MTAGVHQAKPDFFERVIDKALGTDGAIAPRLRSLFEPAPGSSWLEERDAGDAATAHRSREALPPAPPPREMQPDRGPPQDIAVRPAGDEPTPAAPAHRPVFVDARIVAQSPEPATPRAAALLVAPDADDAGDPVDGTLRPPRAVAAIPRGPHRDDDASPPAPGHARISLPITLARRRDPASQGEAEASGVSASPQLVPDSRVTIEGVFATPSRLAHHQPGDRPAEASAAPSVNITIGRVEVRAVSAPAPRPRAEPRGAQPLGLDEYLKRRGAR
jgi:hypothetical protein